MNVEEFAAVQKWKTSLIANSRTRRLSKGTWSNCTRYMREFCELHKTNPDELLTLDVDTIKSFIDEYFREKQKTVAYNTARTAAFSSIRGFFSHHAISFGKWRTPPKRASKVMMTDRAYTLTKVNGKREIELDVSNMNLFLSHLSFRDNVIAVTMLATGHDSGDVLSLTVGDIRSQIKCERFYWSDDRNKTVNRLRTFISPKVFELVKTYLDEQRKEADDSEPLFINKTGGALSGNILSQNYRNAAKTMGLKMGKHTSNPLRPKRLRKVFRSLCAAANVNDGFCNVFMGHATSISQDYIEKPTEVLEAEYMRLEPYIDSLFGSSGESVGRDELLRMIGERDERIEQLQDDLAEVQNFTAYLENLVKFQKDIMLKHIPQAAEDWKKAPAVTPITEEEKEDAGIKRKKK